MGFPGRARFRVESARDRLRLGGPGRDEGREWL
jgi:hypothetical protein